MITFTRRYARALRPILRRNALGLPRTGPAPPLVFQADGSRLRAYYRHDGTAIEHAIADRQPAAGPIALPLDALAELEGRGEDTVAIEAAGPGRTIASWSDRGVPRSREFDVPTIGTHAGPPPEPVSWSEAPDGLLDALAEAALTAGEPSPRYALDLVRFGDDGTIAATDGRQILIQAGYPLPGGGAALVRLPPFLARRDLPRDRPASLGRADGHVALRVGPWTLWLAARDGVRFPDLRGVVPDPHAATTRLRLDPADAASLAGSLARLPGADEPHAPATLDLNGRIAVRAGGGEPRRIVELVLARSSYSGPPARLATDRAFLARAARLGFAEIELGAASAPPACRDARRSYAWMPLPEAVAIPPADDAVRIEAPIDPGPAAPPAPAGKPGPDPSPRTVAVATRPPTTGAVTDPTPTSPPGPASLVEEAVTLHDLLGDARARASRLVVALRRERKRSRLLTSTLAQLRQLRLQEVAD